MRTLLVGTIVLGISAGPGPAVAVTGDEQFVGQSAFGTSATIPVAWGDFDRDGDFDLAVGNYFNQANELYVNEGGNAFTRLTPFGNGNTFAVAWADYDNDGDLDLAVGNNGQNWLYTQEPAGVFTQSLAFGVNRTVAVAWADADGDGDLDLAVGNGDFTSADQNDLYVNDGAGAFTEVPAFGGDSTDGVAWADSDGDGDLDLAVGNEHTTAQNALYVNQLGAADWLRIALVGRFHAFGSGYSNRDGVGASVTVYEAGHLGEAAFRLGRQAVVAAGGFQSQNAMALTFGVPGQAAVDVEIEWPGSGGTAYTQTVFAVAVDQAVTISETKTGDVNGDGAVTFGDLLVILGAWGPCPGCPEDLNGDGAVTFADVLIVLGAWG